MEKSIEVNLPINCVIVIQSLLPNESQTGKQLYDDIIKRRCSQHELNSGIVNVKNKDEFLNLASTLLEKLQPESAKPLLHFEVHGCEEGLQLASGEIVGWDEVGSCTRSINEYLGNTLFISLATCKGAHILKSIDPTIRAPFWGILGPKQDISHEEVVNDFNGFYDELLNSFDLQKAIDILNDFNPSAVYVWMTSEFVFDEFLVPMIKKKLETKIERFKRLFPDSKNAYPLMNRKERRQQLKSNIKQHSREKFVKDCRNTFLFLK
ncbi:hypothetical protein GCM10023231_17220 [Olivibacter ginsenosidimutans]|uniref:CHAT domain-containing protein n=1 Tax=Olivibacter ginsenosidimutans TaxID=1176537 RepID=A0ABP9B6D1_9SPHI